MDISAFSSDIDELVEAFTEIRGVELSQIKELWKSRSFTFIHEAKPNHVDPAFFMQALYSCALGFLEGDMPWLKKLGGLYVLYILYETQLFTPPFKIYLSTDDLENIYSLVKEAKAKGPLTALRVVNKMIMKDSFLYGSVTTNQKKMREAIDTLSSKAAERVQLARKRLFASSAAKQHFEGNLVKELGLDELVMLNEEYTMVKQRMYTGAAQGTEDSFRDLGPVLGSELKKDANSWMERRKRFYQKEGHGNGHENGNEMEVGGKKGQKKGFEMEEEGNEGPEDGFEMELERTLEEG